MCGTPCRPECGTAVITASRHASTAGRASLYPCCIGDDPDLFRLRAGLFELWMRAARASSAPPPLAPSRGAPSSMSGGPRSPRCRGRNGAVGDAARDRFMVDTRWEGRRYRGLPRLVSASPEAHNFGRDFRKGGRMRPRYSRSYYCWYLPCRSRLNLLTAMCSLLPLVSAAAGTPP